MAKMLTTVWRSLLASCSQGADVLRQPTSTALHLNFSAVGGRSLETSRVVTELKRVSIGKSLVRRP